MGHHNGQGVDGNADATRRTPRHIAIIMDGNGRWARSRGLPRWEGHRAGAEAVRRALRACRAYGVEALTLFSFSSENWRRPREEIDALMRLLCDGLRAERDQLIEHDVRLRQIGVMDSLPQEARRELQDAIDATALSDDVVDFINWAARYVMCPVGSMLRMTMRSGAWLSAPAAQTGFARADVPPARMTPQRAAVMAVAGSAARTAAAST